MGDALERDQRLDRARRLEGLISPMFKDHRPLDDDVPLAFAHYYTVHQPAWTAPAS